MKLTIKSAALGVSAAVIAGGLMAVGTGSAYADSGATSPDVPYSPDPAAIGTIQLFDASGHAQTSGSMTNDPFVAYAMASGTGVNAGAQDTKATMYLYTPTPGQLPVTWQGNSQTTLSTDYPNTAAPANIASSPNAVATVDAGLGTLADYTAANPNTATNNYAGLYELRILTSHAGGSLDPNQYYAADIKVTGTTWTLVNPAPAAAISTSTTLAANPATGADTSTNVTLTATETAASGSTAHPDGFVQFMDGAATIGDPIEVDANGVAASPATTFAAGSHSLSAVFTPADTSSFSGSTGDLAYSVAGVATPTHTGLSSIGGPANSAIVLNATVTADSGPFPGPASPGTVSFAEGPHTLGSAVVDPTTGDASFTYNFFDEGTHNVIATFLPADSGAFTTSTSASVGVIVTAGVGPAPDPQTVTATVLAGSLTINTPYNGSNSLDLGTLQPNAAGTMLSTSAPFGDGTPEGSILITDTRAGNLPWTASALSGVFDNGSGGLINPENLGLTDVTALPISGNVLTSASVTTSQNPAAAGVAVDDLGTVGLGGTAPHAFAHADQGFGSIGFGGTMTLNAPTSTVQGVYTATVVFTVG